MRNTTKCPRVILTALFLISVTSSGNAGQHDKHGGVKMGVVDMACDDGVHGVEKDWDEKDNEPFTCTEASRILPGTADPKELNEEKTEDPTHTCLQLKIRYNTKQNNTIPLSGAHRPLWPIYGEYKYVPPQRWLHSLEHGAIVFLYHPCALKEQVEMYKKVVASCIWKHIISPSKLLSVQRPFALLSWGHGIFMDHFDEYTVREWIKKHGLKDGPESTNGDGQYKLGLKKKAQKIGDGTDTSVCPGGNIYS